jgi:hypothetical protein
MSLPITFRVFDVLTSEMVSRRLPVFTLLLWQRQHIIVVDAAILTFDPQPNFCFTFSVKHRYQLHYFICIKDFNAETFTSIKSDVMFVEIKSTARLRSSDRQTSTLSHALCSSLSVLQYLWGEEQHFFLYSYVLP